MCVVSLLNAQRLGQAKPASAHRGLLVFLSYPNEGLDPNKSFLYNCAGRYSHPKFSSYIHHQSLSIEESSLNARLQQQTLHCRPRENEHFSYLSSYREEIKVSRLLQSECEQGMGRSIGLDSFIVDF